TDAFRVRIEGYEDLASPMLPVQMPVPELEEVAEHYREEFIGDWVAEAYTRARGIWKRIETVATATRNVCLHQRRHTTQATADDARRTAELFLLAA
ncbi:MAG: hypothetical protein HYU66_00600, partial [Armatimonadetes bacterium]|nr:hypothetical protein [Armatimonadota bacterium]